MTATRAGCGLVEALAALALAAIAFALVAASVRVGTWALRRAGAHQAGTTAALERLEALRGAPRAAGTDVVPGPPVVARAWRHVAGRGRPDTIAVEAECDGARVALGSAVWP